MSNRPDLSSRGSQQLRNSSHSQTFEAEALERRSYMDGLTFSPPVAIGVGNNPEAIAVASLRPDGLPDIVTVNKSDSTMEVLLNNGNGTFAAHDSFTAGRPDAVAVGDFNNDGINDIVVACQKDDMVQIFLGNGNGTFQNAISFAVGFLPEGVAVGDFSNDGLIDIAVANFGSNSVSVLMNNGSFLGHPVEAGQGMFLPQVTYAVGTGPDSVAVADLNGDGQDDIITTNLDVHTASVLFGNGDGTFGNRQDINVGNDPESVAVADLNGDHIPDLVVADLYDNSVDVLIGNGDGTFKPGVTYLTGVGPGFVAVGDMNGDGIADLVVADSGTSNTGGGTFCVLVGNGDGTFGAPGFYNIGDRPSAVGLGDFNGDGQLDVAAPDSNYTTISIAYNETPRTPPQPIITQYGGIISVTGTAGDDVAELINDQEGHLVVVVDGENADFTLSTVQQIDVSLLAGNDSILIEGGLPSCVVVGGLGNDTIIADNGVGDTLVGGQGTDSITAAGFGGNDLINGGHGADTLLGGLGIDTLHGGRGNDSLVAGNASGAGVFDGGTGTNIVVLAQVAGDDFGFTEIPIDSYNLLLP